MKCRRSRVAIWVAPRRSASAITHASTRPRRRSAYWRKGGFNYSLQDPVLLGSSGGTTNWSAMTLIAPGLYAETTTGTAPGGGSCATGCLWYYPGQSASNGTQSPLTTTPVFVGVLSTAVSQLS